MLAFLKIADLHESPRLGVEEGGEGQEAGADPDDEQEDPGAGLGHAGLQWTNDSDISEGKRKN